MTNPIFWPNFYSNGEKSGLANNDRQNNAHYIETRYTNVVLELKIDNVKTDRSSRYYSHRAIQYSS